MDQKKINLEVQAHWLRYHGLTIESVHAWHRLDNAAWKTTPRQPIDRLETGGLMVAT